MLDVLVIAPHPDDAELSMAGTILRLQESGQRVGVLDLTSGEPTPHGDIATREKETAAASLTLNLTWRKNLGLANRSLQADLEARGALANVIRETQPRWLFAPYWIDAHPDHVAATQLVEDARFWSKLTKSHLLGEPHHPARIYYYFSVHLRLAIQPAFIVDISPFWETKRAALECFHSQFVSGRESMQPSFIDRLENHAAHWGHLIGKQYGEPFATREPLGISSLDGLV